MGLKTGQEHRQASAVLLLMLLSFAEFGMEYRGCFQPQLLPFESNQCEQQPPQQVDIDNSFRGEACQPSNRKRCRCNAAHS
jgi:hypothetical protein